ncbi:MAG: DUF1992 domain-containing protein [Nocardioides sp.]|nr:DUF1992 domain-containing protein [Nocardioides sp.]
MTVPKSEDWSPGRPSGKERAEQNLAQPEQEHADERPSDQAPRSGREPKGSAAAAARMQQAHLWVELQVTQAMERGEFDDLPGQGKPIDDLGERHDPDWWLKKLVEREKISVLPPALELRKENLRLDAALDRENVEKRVRDILEDFNRRVVAARRQLEGGPPVVTPTRDVDVEVARWHERRTARRAAAAAASEAEASNRPRRRWWQRRA